MLSGCPVRRSTTTGSTAGHIIERGNLSLKRLVVFKSSWRVSEVFPFCCSLLTSDANLFLRENPWPDRYSSGFDTDAAQKNSWAALCFPNGEEEDIEAQNGAPQSSNPTQNPSPKFHWTEALQQNFREELEKLVILDYMMRNTGSSPDHVTS
jgi:hypothetical protein